MNIVEKQLSIKCDKVFEEKKEELIFQITEVCHEMNVPMPLMTKYLNDAVAVLTKSKIKNDIGNDIEGLGYEYDYLINTIYDLVLNEMMEQSQKPAKLRKFNQKSSSAAPAKDDLKEQG